MSVYSAHSVRVSRRMRATTTDEARPRNWRSAAGLLATNRLDREGRDLIMGHPTQNQLPIPAELAELLANRIRPHLVETDNGCWIRTSRAPTPSGYTHVSKMDGARRRHYYAHRVMYVAAKGPIPDGYTVDHLCDNRPCCNPAHLRAVPHHLNVNRGENNYYAINARKTHCNRGHQLPPYRVGGKRRCAECHRIDQRAYMAKKRGA